MATCIKNLGIQPLLQNTKIIEENILQHIAIEEKTPEIPIHDSGDES